MNLLTEEHRKFSEERLIKALDNYDWKLGIGFLSTPFILYVLETISPDYAYKLLLNEKMPGWLFMAKKILVQYGKDGKEQSLNLA